MKRVLVLATVTAMIGLGACRQQQAAQSSAQTPEPRAQSGMVGASEPFTEVAVVGLTVSEAASAVATLGFVSVFVLDPDEHAVLAEDYPLADEATVESPTASAGTERRSWLALRVAPPPGVQPWFRGPHTARVKRDGAAHCFTCHQETLCSFCHVRSTVPGSGDQIDSDTSVEGSGTPRLVLESRVTAVLLAGVELDAVLWRGTGRYSIELLVRDDSHESEYRSLSERLIQIARETEGVEAVSVNWHSDKDPDGLNALYGRDWERR